jgi:pimeloyl-ACP methyl ester carboxylesterase
METTKSADGTVIAYDRAGDGPPLIVSVGAFCTRQTFVPPGALRQRFTVITYDRRGRGDSGDAEPFTAQQEAAQRELEDLAAVATAVCATASPQRPFLFGHSSGAAIVLRAAAAGLPAAGIVAYEAPFGNEDSPRPTVDPAARIRELVSSGRRREAVAFWMSEVIHLPEEVLGQMDGAPWVTALEPLTPTLPYDIAVTDGGVPTAELAAITAPVLILGGNNSPAWFRRSVAEQAAATPGARLTMLDEYDHNAPPEVIAPILIGFFGVLPSGGWRGGGTGVVLDGEVPPYARRSFWTLPVAFSGRASMNATVRGTLKPAIRSLAQAMSSSASATAPGARTTNALPTWPMRSSGTPMTAACATAGCSMRKPSISAG